MLYSLIFRWGTHVIFSVFPSVYPSICLSIHRTPYLRSCASSDHNFWCMCKIIMSPGVFFIFFKILIFQDVRGVKGQKLAQNGKEQFHPLRTISQEQYSIWSWFLVHLCKMMIYPCAFFIFLKFWFFGLLVG